MDSRLLVMGSDGLMAGSWLVVMGSESSCRQTLTGSDSGLQMVVYEDGW